MKEITFNRVFENEEAMEKWMQENFKDNKYMGYSIISVVTRTYTDKDEVALKDIRVV